MLKLFRLISSGIAILALTTAGCAPAMTEEISKSTTSPTLAKATEQSSGVVTPIATATGTPSPGEMRQIASGEKVIFWHSYSLYSLASVDLLVADFNDTNPDGINVEARGFLTDSQLKSAVGQVEDRSDLPDVIMAESSLVSLLWREGDISAIDPYITDDLIGLPVEQRGAISDTYWADFTADDIVYAIPAQRTGYFLLYNATWGRELGFAAPPEDLQEFITQARAAFESNSNHTDKTKRGTGGWLLDLEPETVLAWMGRLDSAGEEWDVFSDPALEDTLLAIKDMQNQGYAWAGRSADPVPYFANRQALFISANSHDMQRIISYLETLGMQDEWSIIAYPHTQSDAENISNGSGFALTADNEAQRLAGWLFIQWMMDPARQALISGTDFTSPADSGAIDLLKDFGMYPTLVQAIAQVNASSINLPDRGEWYLIRPILADGYYQALLPHIPQSQILGIIQEMQKLLAEFRP